MTEEEHKFDERLISKVANNDINALNEIYNISCKTVFGLALSITKNKSDAEDILHDTYIKVYEKASTYKSMGKPMAWICTIARNLSLMKIRNNKKINDFDYSNDINYSYISNDNKLILESAFKALSDEELQIVMLYSTYGLKHKEIADILDIPLSTILSKYNRSLKKMSNYLEGGTSYEKV